MEHQLVTVFLRTMLFYFVVLVMVRLMGKREVGQLSPFDLVVSIMIAEAAVFAIEDPALSVWHGVIPILTLAILQILISLICLRYPTVQALFNGRPSVIIERGRLNQKNMRRARYTLHELMEQLRLQGTPAISDVEYAILEMSGKLSVLPKAESRPVQPSDMGLKPPVEGLPVTLVVDGTVNKEGLRTLNQDEAWLHQQLRAHQISDIQQVFMAAVDRLGNLWIQERENTR